MEHASPSPGMRLRAWSGLAAFYAATFAVLGVFMQFFPLWLHRERGLSAQEVTWVFAALTAARTVAGPLWAQRADRTGRARWTLIVLALLSLLTFATFGFAEVAWALMACGFLFGCCYPAIHPILDALAMGTAARLGFAYARLRMAGSIAFLVAVVGVGAWLSAAPTAIVFDLALVGLVLVCGASLLLPDGPRVERAANGSSRAPIGTLLRSGPFVLLLVVTALIQGSHAVYYNLSTIHWREHGIAEGTAGLLWAEMVLAEIVLFFFARSTIERLRPTSMLILGGGAAALRWLALGATTSVPLLFAVNWLHAFSFGCTYLGGLRMIEQRVPASQRATAQGLLAAAAYGIGLVIAAPVGGLCYERFGGGAFFAMALLGLAGAVIALLLRRRSSAAASAQSSAPDAPA